MTARSNIVLGLIAVLGISTGYAQDIRDDEAEAEEAFRSLAPGLLSRLPEFVPN